MARNIYCKDVKFSEYSLWHRSKPNPVAMMDVDKVSTCIACNKPLFLAETTRFVGKYHKAYSMTKQLADMAKLPAWIIFYVLKNNEIDHFKIKKIAPEIKSIQNVSPEAWLEYLEKMQTDHFPNCPKQELFLLKMKNANSPNYEKLLSSRH